jgi:hypothetical protein
LNSSWKKNIEIKMDDWFFCRLINILFKNNIIDFNKW